MREIILHCFQWKLKDIISQLKIIKESGYTTIQISPIQPTKNKDYNWWLLYQPLGFRIGNEQIGSKEDLIKLCTDAKKYNLKIIVDVILTHVAGKDNGKLIPHELVDENLINNIHFWKEPKLINNWENRNEVINYCDGLPGLQLKNHDLQNIIIDFLNELIDCGISGFRFDSGKAIALPEEDSDFWIRVLDNLKSKELFNYAELIFIDKELINKYFKYVNAVTNSFGDNKNKMIVYIESHDSYLGLGWTKHMTDNMLIKEWELLLQNKEWNVLFYTRPFSNLWKDNTIKNINKK